MNRLQYICRRALCVPIRAYQYTLSPWIGRSCRFTPSCSNYTMQAIMTHGCVKGILLGAWRIARCNPFGKWGFDPMLRLMLFSDSLRWKPVISIWWKG